MKQDIIRVITQIIKMLIIVNYVRVKQIVLYAKIILFLLMEINRIALTKKN